MTLRDSKPDYDTYFSDPALVKAFYIPTDPIKLTEKQRMVGTLLESSFFYHHHSFISYSTLDISINPSIRIILAALFLYSTLGSSAWHKISCVGSLTFLSIRLS